MCVCVHMWCWVHHVVHVLFWWCSYAVPVCQNSDVCVCVWLRVASACVWVYVRTDMCVSICLCLLKFKRRNSKRQVDGRKFYYDNSATDLRGVDAKRQKKINSLWPPEDIAVESAAKWQWNCSEFRKLTIPTEIKEYFKILNKTKEEKNFEVETSFDFM